MTRACRLGSKSCRGKLAGDGRRRRWRAVGGAPIVRYAPPGRWAEEGSACHVEHREVDAVGELLALHERQARLDAVIGEQPLAAAEDDGEREEGVTVDAAEQERCGVLLFAALDLVGGGVELDVLERPARVLVVAPAGGFDDAVEADELGDDDRAHDGPFGRGRRSCSSMAPGLRALMS